VADSTLTHRGSFHILRRRRAHSAIGILVITVTSITPAFPANPWSNAMTTVSYHFESPIRIVLNAASASAHSTKSAMQTSSREAMEERRWQLEWERRNVED
jgi:hypothetical protein